MGGVVWQRQGCSSSKHEAIVLTKYLYMGGFPKIGAGTFLGIPRIRRIVCWGPSWGPPIFGKLPREAAPTCFVSAQGLHQM